MCGEVSTCTYVVANRQICLKHRSKGDGVHFIWYDDLEEWFISFFLFDLTKFVKFLHFGPEYLSSWSVLWKASRQGMQRRLAEDLFVLISCYHMEAHSCSRVCAAGRC